MTTARQTVGLFWRHAWRYPWYVIGLLIFVPTAVVLNGFLPTLIAAGVLTRLSSGNYAHGDLWGSFGSDLIIYAIITFIGGVAAWRLNIYLIWNLEMRVTRDLSQRIFDNLLHKSAYFHANNFGGSLVSRANKLVGAYIRFADTVWFEILTMITAFAAMIIILWPRSPLFVMIILGISALFMVTVTLFSKIVQKRSAEEAAAQNRQTGFLADAVTNVMAIKSFAAENYENKRFAAVTEESRSATYRYMKAELWRDTIASNITSSITVASLALAAASVVMFNAEIGTVFLLLTYTSQITERLWEFSTHILRSANRALGDAHEMTKILMEPTEVNDPIHPEKVAIGKGGIEFKHMTFAHSDAKETLFSNLNLTVRPGEKVGLVGHSGSGKTTLTKLLLRYADLNSGEILIDGQNIAHITQNDLRSHIAYVPQEPLLFHRTITENIAYGKQNATKAEIRKAAEGAHAAEFIKKLSSGYDTLVGERGVKLSGGQRQRVAIARAMLCDAPILLLDEATSALDSESEKLIQAALWKLMEGRTALVIAHRLSTVQRMDRILVMEDGKIVEQGSHIELLEKGGVYSSLWKHQSGGFIED